MKGLVKGYFLAAVALAVAALASSASAGTLGAGSNAGSITINANGSVTVVGPSGTYDNVEDFAYNVFNNSSSVLLSLNLTGTGIFGLDGDGINNYVNTTGAALSAGLYGTVQSGVSTADDAYAGYNNSLQSHFTGYVSGGNTGTIVFAGGGVNANGGTSFFSLEAPAGASATLQVTATTVPLPAAAWMGLGTLAALGLASGLRKRKLAAIV